MGSITSRREPRYLVRLPILLTAIITLANNPEIMGEYKNRFIHNIFAIGTAAIVTVLSLLLIGKTIADMF